MDHEFSRRQLIYLGTVLTGVGICRTGERIEANEQSRQTHRETARDIPSDSNTQTLVDFNYVNV